MSNTLSSRAKSAISHRLVRILLSIFLPVTAFGILLITEGKDPIATYGVILNAVFGSRYGFGEVIVKATLLILTSLTAILPYRVGMANAGGEGQMAIGALTAAVAGTTFLRQVPAPIGIPLMLLSGMIGGGIWAGIAVLFKMKLRMNETLCSILMNYIATYDVRRAGSIAFEKIPVDASSKMPDDYMDSIEPYDYAELRPFSTAYLPGFLADKYDVSVEDSRERADTRCAGSLLSALERTVSGYTSCNETSRDIHLKRGKVHYALLPVWILNTRWEGKDFLFAMNGQTGKLVGNLPVSTKRVIGLFAAIAAPLIAISVTALLLLAR